MRTKEQTPTVAARPAPSRQHLGELAFRFLPAVIVVAASLALWDFCVWVFGIEPWLLPRVMIIIETLFKDFGYLMGHAAYTFQVVLWGFVSAVVIGVGLAMLIVYWPPFERAVYPLLIFSQTVPKIAVAPLFAIWLGLTILPHILVAFLISFFPIVLDSVAGLKSVPPEMLSLARSMGSSRGKIFRKISLPYSLPYIFTGLKVAITFAVVGALVGEWVGSERGLGYVLLVAYGELNTPLTFAGILVLALMGTVLFYTIYALEKMIISWHVSERVGGTL